MLNNHQPNVTIRIRTPDGTLFVWVNEKDNKIESVKLQIGKAGAAVAAWADAMAAMINLALSHGTTLDELIETLSNITSDRSARTIESNCRSGPEGVWMALIRYRKRDDLILYEDEEAIHGTRGASVAPWAKIRRR